jgi:hypothetical protein
MKSAIKPTAITDASRIDALKDIISSYRKENGWKSAYELYGIRFGRGAVKTKVVCLDSAPTSGDFAPMIKKTRIASSLEQFDIVAEFRGAWKSDDKAKVVGYEENLLPGQTERIPLNYRTA